ncbi:hypothetical protein ACFS29_10210 [Psychroserpens luteus]|uniref:Uncharacterized protein n=1 Tax=Psychroserpens luteus TaxID=1434066 RepID=A0ABW5ZSR7_9FLAO
MNSLLKFESLRKMSRQSSQLVLDPQDLLQANFRRNLKNIRKNL